MRKTLVDLNIALTFRSFAALKTALNKSFAIALVLPVLCVISPAQAQDDSSSAATQEVSDTANRPQLLYIDPPVAVTGNMDPIIAPPPAPRVAEDDPQFSQRSASIIEYSQSIQEMEVRGGVWDQGLAQDLTALGTLQQRQGYHREAIETLTRAIHINRINSGLHSLEQIPAVEQLIGSHIAQRDWEQVDLYYNYLFYVQQKAFGPNDPRMIPILDSLANWNIRAFNIGYGESLGLRLSTATILFNAAARMVNMHFGRSDERIVGYMQSIAHSAYLVARNPQLMADLGNPEYRITLETLKLQLDERASINPAGFATGERALLEIARIYNDKPGAEVELAHALANLGDWYLIFGRRNGAATKYGEAWGVLGNLANPEQERQKLFGQVLPIPTFISTDALATLADKLAPEAQSDEAEVEEALQSDYADIMFDVTESGLVRNIELINEESAENAGQLSRLRREVRNSYFRPLVVDGVTQRSNGQVFRYRYWF